MSDSSQYDDRVAGTYHADNADAKTLKQFIEWLDKAEVTWRIPDHAPPRIADPDKVIAAFLAQRRERKEQAYSRFWRRA